MLAAEFGATWDDVVGTMVLTKPAFGLVAGARGAAARAAGFDAAPEVEADDNGEVD